MQSPWQRNIVIIIFQWNYFWEEKMKTRENKSGQAKNFQNYPFWTYIEKKSTHSLFGAWSFLLVHIQFTPREKPKGFVIWFFKKPNHGSWTIKSDHGKMPSSMVHGVNRPLAVRRFELVLKSKSNLWSSMVNGSEFLADDIGLHFLLIFILTHHPSDAINSTSTP